MDNKPLKITETESSTIKAFGGILGLESVTAHLYNSLLNISIDEKKSGSSASLGWKYLYDGTNWGNSNYYEHYGVYTQQTGLIKSEDLTISSAFNNPDGTGIAKSTLYSGDAQIKRDVSLAPNSRNFQIKYTLKNIGTGVLNDARFYQIIDFDVPDTGSGHQCDDDAEYNSLNDYTVVKDENYFQNGFSADITSSRHGIAYYSTELYNDWDDYNLNNNNDC